MSVGTESYGPRAYRDPSVLRMLYLGRGLSLREVARELGCGHVTVHDWMRTYGIERRPAPPQLVADADDVAAEEGSA